MASSHPRYPGGSPTFLDSPGGGSIRLFSFGAAGGRELLYCHGWPGSGIQAALADETARRHGFHLLSPDRPGIGGSSHIPGRRIADWPPMAAAIARHAGWKAFDILAVSGGCPYALATAAALPDRVRSVTVCCGAALPRFVLDPRTSYPIYRALHFLYRKVPFALSGGLQMARLYMRVIPPAFTLLPFLPFLPPADRRAVRPRRNRILLSRSVAAAFRQPPRGVLRDATRYIEDWGIDLAAIRAPVRFHHGSDDRNIPVEAARGTAAEVPGASFNEVPGQGHYSLPLTRIESIVAGI
ncbi:MAG: alpha/beta fold hydrolase [Puniceicoccaceae bacterium]